MMAGFTFSDLARDPALHRFLLRARRRLEETGGELEGVSISLSDPTDDERRRIELVLGVVKRGKGLRIRLDRTDEALRNSSLGAGLLELLEEAGGPLRNRPRERDTERRAADEFWREAVAHPAIAKHPPLVEWLEKIRVSGRVQRLGGNPTSPLLRRALGVLSVLPAARVDRAVLAAELFGDAHALDDDRPEARLVLSALVHISRTGSADDLSTARASGRRALWEAQGVLSDSISNTVLLLRLAPMIEGPLTRGLSDLSASGLVIPVTLDMLAAHHWRWPDFREVFISENPTVLGVASRRLGERCPPMVCVSGMPTLAARELLTGLQKAGIRLRYHGDFGAGGIRIGNIVIGEHGAEPWRFSTEDYEQALATCDTGTRISSPISDAVWDEHLAPALRRSGLEIQEEQVLPSLLEDLEQAEPAPLPPGR